MEPIFPLVRGCHQQYLDSINQGIRKIEFPGRIFVTGTLNDPVNDQIDAVVVRESHLNDPGEGPIVLGGSLAGTTP